MTVSTTANRKSFAGDGSTVHFDFPYIFFEAAELSVYKVAADGTVTLLTSPSQYSVSGGDGAVGAVTTVVAPAVGETLLIVRTVSLTQLSDFVNGDESDAEVLERQLDRLTMMSQQLATQIQRSVAFADSDVSGANPTLPAPVASNLIGWNAAATALANYAGTVVGVPVSPFMVTVLGDQNGPAVCSTIGAATASALTAVSNALAAFLVGSVNVVVNSVAALRAVSHAQYTRVSTTGYYTAGDGGAGQYYYDSSDITSADNGGTVIVASDGGRWKLVYTSLFSAKQFGAKADWNGVSGTDDTSALQAALNVGPVYIPPRSAIKVSSLNVPAGSGLIADSNYGAAIITSSATADVLTLADNAILENIQIGSAPARTGGNHIKVIGNGVKMRNLQLKNYFIGITVGEYGVHHVVANTIDTLQMFSPVVAAGSGAIQYLDFSGCALRNAEITGPSSGTQPDFSLRVRNGDTLYVSDTNITLHGPALLDVPAGQNLYSLKVSNTDFDSAGATTSRLTSYALDAQPAGGIYDTTFSSVWFGLSTGGLVRLTPSGAGKIDGIQFVNPTLAGTDASKNGLEASCTLNAVVNIVVQGGTSAQCASGVYLNNVVGVTVSGHRSGNIAGRGTCNIGINLGGATDRATIVGNNGFDCTSAGYFSGSSGTHITAANNA